MTPRHGSETFFILGEGLVVTAMGGRSGTEPDPIEHPEAAASAASVLPVEAEPPFRFSRVGPEGQGASSRALARKLANAMVTFDKQPEGDVPAGYTYLGQFIDHDLTMDVTDVRLGEDVTAAELLQARSPSLDLDSLYGAGPSDPESAKFYEADGLHLKTGDTVRVGPDREKVGHDLPRVGTGGAKQRRRALIPDKRNDENLIVAQTHLAMIHFHNRVRGPAARLDAAGTAVPPGAQAGDAALPVADPARLPAADRAEPTSSRTCSRTDASWWSLRRTRPTCRPCRSSSRSPASVSGTRMVRTAYDWNRRFPGEAGSLFYMFDFSALGGTLGGNAKLASNWIADWRRMYDFAGGGHSELVGPNGVNLANRIDTLLADPLKFLPASVFGEREQDVDFEDPARNLAFRNLVRGSMLKLASGQQMVERLARSASTCSR